MSQASGSGGRSLTDLGRGLARRLARRVAAKLPKMDSVVIENRKEPITDWRVAKAGSIISVQRNPLIGPEAKIFAMGSCFAVEIRKALSDLGFDVLPKYYGIEFDRAVMKLSGLPVRDSINHYDTFTIRQEFERAFAPQEPREEDYWRVDSKVFADAGPEVYQDPARKLVFGRDLEAAFEATRKLDACLQTAVREADVYIITLGLTEVWKNLRNGRYACQAPLKPNPDAAFERSDFASNLANMRRVCGLLREHFPQKKVILTVSPVALRRTFTGRDIVVANMESKSILRTVAGQIEREFDNVLYWPSFEVASRENIFEQDGRHVSAAGVDKIVSAFVAAHCEVQGLAGGDLRSGTVS